MRYKTLVLKAIGCCLTLLPAALLADTFGNEADNRLIGTTGFDVMYGGDGADTFVLDLRQDEPDWIVDFDPEEGDRLELLLGDLKGNVFAKNAFQLTRKGLLTLELDAQEIPLVDIGSGRFKFEVDVEKDRYFLKFKRELRAN